MTYPEKLSALRKQMQTKGIDAYIIPSSDPHTSEYLPKYYKAILYATGFTGSVSTVVITQEFAGVWVDSRYYVQAEEQLKDSGFQMVKLNVQGAFEYICFLAEKLPVGATVGYDERLVSVFLIQNFEKQLASKKIKFAEADLINEIWTDRPSLPQNKAFLLPDEAVGQTVTNKLQLIRAELKKQGADAHWVSSLDDLAWIFNIRGNDVNYNPVVLGFALITEKHANIYIHTNKLNDEEKTTLAQSGVSVLNYNDIAHDLAKLTPNTSILIDPKRSCIGLYKKIPSSVVKIFETNPSTFLKAVKNETEIANTKAVMVKDGVAVTKFLKWIKDNVGKIEITEITAAKKLYEFRAEQAGFLSESFNTISAYKAHGALPHYSATQESDAVIKPEGLFLIDSGGQYHYGTTDITRVIPLGKHTEEEKTDYTLTLKAMIEGCKIRFPKGAYGYQIDAITRRPMWEHALNYGHGTGHGVGYYLNVHEGPHVLNSAAIALPVCLGAITSVEPGIYRPGQYGIRIENLVLTVPDESNEFNEFYKFEPLTLAPIDTALVKKDLLDETQINWLNNYHEKVFEQLSTFLNQQEKDFLKEMTKAI